MDILEHSLQVLSKEWPGILGLLGIFCLGGGAVFFGLKAIFKDSLTFGEYFALSAGGAPLALLVTVLLIGMFNLFSGVKIGFLWGWALFMAAAVFAAGRAFGWSVRWKFPKPASIVLGLILICSVFLRLAFVHGLLVPLYFDSAMHYTIVTDLLKNFKSFSAPSFQSFVGGYYHLGFHMLAASFSLVLQLSAQNAILLFGQTLLALLPLPLFFIVHSETKLAAPALFAVLLAGLGWYMPAHMLDWGKYPALASLLSFEFAVCSLMLLRHARGRSRWVMAGLVLLSMGGSTFMHSRSLVLIGMAIASGLIAAGWNRLTGAAQKLIPAMTVAGLLALAFVIQSRPILRLAFDPYLGSQGWMSLIVLVTLPFAFKAYPRASLTCLLFTLFLTSGLLISVTLFFPIYDAQTLLDRPFVEGALFIPITVLGGLGYAGMQDALKHSSFWQINRKNQINVLMAVCLFGALLVQLPHYNFMPSGCCKLFGEQDAAAFEWLDNNAPASANILISGFETVVFESNQPADYSGADAGIWITPFIQRKAILALYNTDFSAQSALDLICKERATYIYAGGTNQSFNKGQLASRPEWYARQLELPGIQVYRVVGCRP